MLAHKHNVTSYLQLARSVAPLLVVVGTLFLSAAALGIQFDQAYVVLAVLAGALTHIVLAPTFNENEFEQDLFAIGRVLGGWVLVVVTLLAVGYAAKVSALFSRRALLLWLASAGIGLVASHLLVRRAAQRVLSRAGVSRSAVIAGVNDVSMRLATELEAHPELGLKVGGFFEDRGPDRYVQPTPGVVGRLADLAEFVKANGTDVVFIALPMRHVQRVIALLDELQDTTVSLYFVPDIFVFDLIQSRMQNIRGMPVISLCETPFYGIRGLAKRVFDVVIASTVLVALIPVLVAIAVAIRVGSPGSVIFRQRRSGLDGTQITVYKFRTMYVSEDGGRVVQAKRDDARVTPIGAYLRKYSLDELPQLVNVLQGRMSLVGPRPHAVAHNEEYRKLIKGYMIRHKVLPGMTGWAQVNGLRGETIRVEDMAARVEYDLAYLREWSLLLDLKILWMTVWIVFKTENTY